MNDSLDLKSVLDAVAVMNIPINYCNALKAVFFLDISGCNCNIIKYTETHSCTFFSMMTRWSW